MLPQTRDSKFPKKIPKKIENLIEQITQMLNFNFERSLKPELCHTYDFFKDHTEEIISIYIKKYFGNCM